MKKDYKADQAATREALKPKNLKPGVKYNRARRRALYPHDPRYTKPDIHKKPKTLYDRIRRKLQLRKEYKKRINA